jgi:hypothetical protein
MMIKIERDRERGREGVTNHAKTGRGYSGRTATRHHCIHSIRLCVLSLRQAHAQGAAFVSRSNSPPSAEGYEGVEATVGPEPIDPIMSSRSGTGAAG